MRPTEAGTASIKVSVTIDHLDSWPGYAKINLTQPVVLEPGSECLVQYPSQDRLFRACECGALSGIFYGVRRADLQSAYGIILTHIEGHHLPLYCGDDFAKAGCIAVLNALGRLDLVQQEELAGWTISP